MEGEPSTLQGIGAKRNSCSRMTISTNSMTGTTADSCKANSMVWDDAILYQVAIDPFQQTAIAGKDEGRAAGLRDGYREGRNIGRSKGWEVGLELGYIYEFSRGIIELDAHKKSASLKGTVQNSLQCNTTRMQTHRWERCIQLSNDLTHMIDEFPDPDALLIGGCMENESVKASINGEGASCQRNQEHYAEHITDVISSHRHNAHSSGSCDTDHTMINDTESLNFNKASISIDPDAAEASMLDISAPLERIRARFKLLCILLKTKQSFDLKNVLEIGIISGIDTHQHQRGITIAIEQKQEIESRFGGEIHSASPMGNTIALDSDW